MRESAANRRIETRAGSNRGRVGHERVFWGTVHRRGEISRDDGNRAGRLFPGASGETQNAGDSSGRPGPVDGLHYLLVVAESAAAGRSGGSFFQSQRKAFGSVAFIACAL